MTTYPKTVWKFIPWSKAMVAGATVGSPEYKGTSTSTSRKRPTKRRRRRKRKKNAKKD